MRRGRRKGGSRDKVFGCDLLEHLSSTGQEIPQVLRSCSEFIEKHGIVDGIYRLSGVSSNTQKLRSEFDTEGSPDLYKDVYLQDIHCVSSLCKAYFRELPNPLLTYELYDRFADAVAIQLEDERLVKITEVLKDLPALHHRTLEYLMRHLVKMSTFASQTNMHSRNLAIVWAPNLLRSKDIESTGFNGTAAFMEVRVQSIVVEFILTHVAELFPGTGLSVERRKSLPSPSILSGEEPFFKSLPVHCPGNLSPGDGPLPIRPYHSIIDGTDKRKGSLKGRKWRSIFNLGGRLQDPRKKNKYCPKDKEKTSLRPAKSMDSLSSGPYAQDDSKHAAPLPLVLSTVSGSSEGVASAGGGVSSGYAVTYRRTGGAQVSMVSGGTPGTYNRLESGGGAEGAELRGVSKSPGMTSKADRRAGIHISGPFSVTVPLHITSGLALGVLHGGWNDKEQPLQGDEAEDEDVKSIEAESTEENPLSKNDDVQEKESETNSQEECGKDMAEITKIENDMPEKEDALNDKEGEYLTQNQESVQENVEDAQPQDKEKTTEEDYMDMRGNLSQEPVSPHYYEDMEFPDPDLPLDFQEAFGFLDSMDSCAVNPVEFSVEAPCFENEYEEEEDENKDDQAVSGPSQNCTNDCQTPAAKSSSPSFTHRPLPGKSHSLPYKSRPFLPALSLSSDDGYSPADDDDDDDESDKESEYEDMFCQSLPAGRDYQGLSWLSPQSNDVDLHTSNQSSALPGNNNDVQSMDQSEDKIPAALTDSGEAAFEPLLSEERLSSDAPKTDEVCMDEKKNEDRHSRDVEQEKHTLIGEDHPESEASEEDTYFGPDSIPSSPEPSSTSFLEPIPAEDVQQVLDADGYHGNTEVTNSAELTDADCVSLASQGEISIETKTEESQTEEGENTEETVKVVRNMEENKEESENDKTDTCEEKCGVAEDANAGSVEECIDWNEEQKQVNMTESKEEFDENKGVCEENAKDGSKEEAKRQDLEKNSGESEEGDDEQEAKTQDLEENSGESEKVDEKEGEQDKKEAERQANLAENNGECEENANDGPKEAEQDRNEAEGRDDLEENSGDFEENAKDGSKEEPKTQDFEENSGECEDHQKGGEQEAKGQEDLKENSGETEKVDEEHTKEEEQEKNEDQRQEHLEENSADCEEHAKENSGDCEEIHEEHAKEGEREAKGFEENSGESEKVDEEHTEEGQEDKNKAECSENNSEEDVKVKTESSIEANPSDDLDKSTIVQRPDENQHEQTESKETEEETSAAPRKKRSLRKPPHPTKAVPAVPPKPQNSKLTALRKQLQHRQHEEKGARADQEPPAEAKDAEESAENGAKLDAEGPAERRGTWDGGVDRRRDVDRDGKRNSGISMCFDEAVARATEKRSRERGSTERLSGAQWKDGKTD
ncbi:rho GTPase-activating protein 31 [Puntigrus tetrazona]|uniref:rho GTPase-activating protein 31 n=1 Tax=Puntigrus tetrazona TaxID=1606681 RepID=UPI001C88EF80|nr:rho GTPase-activating protein 31 [Puntigrus tetrazona]XP_043072650.1 rho GTPase-activating protein 31 [Puntigrus tetrazona]XP_043072660.1 rho GTPase-activating protein 31 [Puntigrus tetrazona]